MLHFPQTVTNTILIVINIYVTMVPELAIKVNYLMNEILMEMTVNSSYWSVS